jgi:hypothetical protein
MIKHSQEATKKKEKKERKTAPAAPVTSTRTGPFAIAVLCTCEKSPNVAGDLFCATKKRWKLACSP